jgi:hypothetical protein
MSLQEAIITRVGNFRRGVLNWWTDREVAHLIKINEDAKKMGQRAYVLGGMDFTYETDRVVVQPFNFKLLKEYNEFHPFMSIISNIIIRGVTNRKMRAAPNWVKKCTNCGREHQSVVEECIKCGSTNLRDPKWSEKQRMDIFLKNPNRQNEWRHIEESILRDCIATGNAYVHMDQILGTNYEWWVEDTEFMWIATDRHAVLGNDVYFCPRCHENGSDQVYTREEYQKLGEICPKCGTHIEETAYIHKKEDRLTRYAKHEIIHFNSDPRLPNPYGWSKIIAVLLQLRSATALSQFNYDNYSLVRMAKIIVHTGVNQVEANSLADAIERQELQLNTLRREQGWIPKILRTLHLGSKKGIEVHDALPNPRDMQSLDWMDYWFVKICAAQFGVQPVYINTAASGGGGGYYQRMQIVINDENLLYWRDVIENGMNEVFLPLLKVGDWHFEHEPIHPKDRREEAQVKREQLAALEQAARLGISGRITDEGHLLLSGEVDTEKIELLIALDTAGGTHSTRVDNLPESPTEPRVDGDENLIPGDDNTPR